MIVLVYIFFFYLLIEKLPILLGYIGKKINER